MFFLRMDTGRRGCHDLAVALSSLAHVRLVAGREPPYQCNPYPCSDLAGKASRANTQKVSLRKHSFHVVKAMILQYKRAAFAPRQQPFYRGLGNMLFSKTLQKMFYILVVYEKIMSDHGVHSVLRMSVLIHYSLLYLLHLIIYSERIDPTGEASVLIEHLAINHSELNVLL